MAAAWHAVLMDLDQTLIDSKQGIVESFRHTYSRVVARGAADVDISGRLMAMWGRPLRDQMVELAGEGLADEMVRVYREHLATLDHLVSVYPGWLDVLCQLRLRGYVLGVVTSKSRWATSRHMDLHGLGELVDVVVTADDTVRHKPDPEPFILAAERVAVAPAHCLAVGDSPWDILAAHRAGMAAALAEWGEYDPAAFLRESARPDIRLKSPEQLLAHCPALAPR